MHTTSVRDLAAFLSMALLSSVLLCGGHLVARSLDPGALRSMELTPALLERLTGLMLGFLGAATLLWLLLSTLLSLVAALGARTGHHRLDARIRRLLPGFLSRLGVAAVGGSILLATPAQAAVPPGQTASQGAVLPVARPAAQSEGPGDALGQAQSPPALLSPGWFPQRISLPLQRMLGAATRTLPDVVVHPGDTLWSIAARHLGPDATDGDIADAWPQWYAANRETIGPDPDRLGVGLVLSPPDPGDSRP
ncbi:LysM peptidoglycan-binding domain-containing protein [Paeniglutamicibacter sp. R2-26]|uniref:LysM peptidoglycan-binding domain-containing protein n=1 Tax=Paeniglutamicibacter sp. R2-26 TaxID=3144417 RepID=UPI003EE6255A